MKTLLVQDYLRSGKTLQDLIIDHGVYSTITNGKIALSYDQIEAKETDQLACECRGLVLEENAYNIIAFPFKRFFNLSQESLTAKDFNWFSAKFYNKYDGTLNILYFHNNRWYIGTRSRCEADVPMDDGCTTFSQLFDIAVREMWTKNQKLFINSQSLDINIQMFMNAFGDKAKDYTFMFELTSPYNRIVCNYPEVSLTLLGVRNNITFQEEDPKLWLNSNTDIFGLKTPEEYSFNNIDDAITVINSWNPEQQEGIVIVDNNFNRIKVKNIQYIIYNKLRSSLSTSIKGCIEVILLGKDDDIVNMMPDLIVNRINKLKPIIQYVLHKAEEDYLKIKHIDNMKEFAAQAEFTIWPSAMYALKRNKTSDLHTWALGNKQNVSSITKNAIETMLNLCEKIDGSIRNIM